VLTSVDITKATGNRLQQCFCIRHIIVTVERTLRCHITQSYDRTVFGNSVHLLGSLYHLMERYCRNVQRLIQHIVIQVIVCTFLAYIRRHTDRMKDKIHLTAQHFHRAFEYILQIFHTGGIRCYDFAIQFFGQCRNFTHTYSDRCIGQGDRCTFFYCFFCYFPGNGLLIQSTKNNASFSFQQIVTHTFFTKF